MNVIDLDIEGHLNNMSHKFSLPDLVRDISFGHRMKAALPTFLRHQYDFTAGISNYLHLTDAGAQTTVFYVVVKGRKHFYILENNESNQKFSTIGNEVTSKHLLFWLPSLSDSSSCSAQKR